MSVYSVNRDTHTSNIPIELRRQAQWVAWRSSGKKKVPVNPQTGKEASPTNPSTWDSFNEAVTRAEADGLSGVGFVVTEDDPFCGIDLDDCRDPDTGEIDLQAAEIVEALDSYTEVSPSGTGLRIWIRGTKPGDRCRTDYGNGHIEIYAFKRYFTVTGFVMRARDVEERQTALDDLYWSLFPEVPKRSEKATQATTNNALSDEQILEKARSNKVTGVVFTKLFDHGNASGFPSRSEADFKLAELLAFWTGPDPDRIATLIRRSALRREKWDKHETYLNERTVAKAIESRKRFYDPQATTGDFRDKRRSVAEAERKRISLELDPDSTDARGLDLLYQTADLCGRCCDEEVEFNANQVQIAGEIEISQRGVSKMLQRLADKGYIWRVKKGSKKKGNSVYRIRKGGYGVGTCGSTTDTHTFEPGGSITELHRGGKELQPVNNCSRTEAVGEGYTDKVAQVIEFPFLDRHHEHHPLDIAKESIGARIMREWSEAEEHALGCDCITCASPSPKYALFHDAKPKKNIAPSQLADEIAA